jgi:hypothetical protein
MQHDIGRSRESTAVCSVVVHLGGGGDGSLSRAITINGCRADITVNLAEADVGRNDPQDGSKPSRGFRAERSLLGRAKKSMTAEERDRQSSTMIDTKTMTYRRRLFMTRRGFMRLGPAATEIGDEVCLFSGGQVLYVVRSREEGRFDFVGECYAHGLMDGEAYIEESFMLRDIVLE